MAIASTAAGAIISATCKTLSGVPAVGHIRKKYSRDAVSISSRLRWYSSVDKAKDHSF